MITLKSLIEEAKKEGLPIDKKRAILREYLQVLILSTIYKSKVGNKMYFMGGTALRYFYKLPRFSEDLDFNAKRLSSREYDNLLDIISKYLKNEGFKINIERKDIYDIYSARIGFKSVMKDFNLVDTRGEDIVIKLETNNPTWQIKYEPLVLSYLGILTSVLVMDRGSLFAEKSHAFIHRCRGRDVYDVIYLLRFKFPIDKRMFIAKKIKGDPKEVLLNKFKSLKESEIEGLSKQVRPFLFKEEEVEFVRKASFYGPQLLRGL